MPLHRVYANLQIRKRRGGKMSFEVVNPGSIAEALDALAADAKQVPLAGATDIMVYLEARSLPPCTFLNLQQLQELKPIVAGSRSGTLGALTTYHAVRTSSVRQQFPMLELYA